MFYCSIARNQNKVVQWFVKPLIVKFHFEHLLLLWGLKTISDSEQLLNYPFKWKYLFVLINISGS